MAQKSMTVHCAKCNHQWEVIIPLPMPIRRFVIATRGAAAAGCPECRAYGNDVLLGPAPNLKPQPAPFDIFQMPGVPDADGSR